MRVIGTETEFSVSPGFSGDNFDAIRQLCRLDNFPSGMQRRKTFFSNGSRYYIDVGNHPEYATPETNSALGATLCEAAGTLLIRHIATQARNADESVFDDQTIVLKRVTNDQESWGYHINIQAERDKLDIMPKSLAPLLLVMLGGYALFGAGHLRTSGEYWVSQKAHHIWAYVNDKTTFVRPLINTRDEPHSHNRWRRVHIVGNDSLHSPWATWLRLATYEITLSLCEARPDIACKMSQLLPQNAHMTSITLGKDPSDTTHITLADGQKVTARNLLEMIYSELQKATYRGDISDEGSNSERAIALDELMWAIDGLNDERLDKLVQSRMRKTLLERIEERGLATTLLEKRSIDIKLDDIECRNKFAEIFQSTLYSAGWERLATIFNLTTETLLAQRNYYVTNPYIGRSALRAAQIKRMVMEKKGDVDWALWSLNGVRYWAPDPAKDHSVIVSSQEYEQLLYNGNYEVRQGSA